ncbi:uncharacterized protein PADG_03501 [Paracoccidioides brasiliensis Pb18]|uniref:CCHC-type domain-containing protein n=1 Tax=Paracoccidioides brasiliensis (strain Pb18) TaxID=502780 RepID=C1G5D1_PARBD|nr:uncharacterized protein PADG_03501 [Paracoccidioides brasiliensis Pb18]EEH47403.2 hypothetical protein PADG_03501 [Paracoccidioides brasiliensis Pb18]
MDTTQPSNSTPLHPEQNRLKEKLTPLETFDGTDLANNPPGDSTPWPNSVSQRTVWDHEIKISMLQKALNLDLLKEMVSQVDTDNNVEYCTKLSMIENKLLQEKAIQNFGQRFTSTAPRTTTTASADAMDWQPSTTYLASHANVTITGKPFGVSGITGADDAERRTQGVCINCAKPGHIASRCTDSFIPVKRSHVRPECLRPACKAPEPSSNVLDIPEKTQYHENPRSPIQMADSIRKRNMPTSTDSLLNNVLHAKHIVLEALGSHNYRLDTPPSIHDVFHSNLLQRAATDSLPSENEEIRNERMNHHCQELPPTHPPNLSQCSTRHHLVRLKQRYQGSASTTEAMPQSSLHNSLTTEAPPSRL